jgi:hypothetical protein
MKDAMKSRFIGRIVFAVVSGILLASCGSGSQSGTVAGELGLFPGPGGSGLSPIAGTVIATDQAGRTHMVAVGSNGKYSIKLPPGTYLIVGLSPMVGGGRAECHTITPDVTVTQGRLSVVVRCEVR